MGRIHTAVPIGTRSPLGEGRYRPNGLHDAVPQHADPFHLELDEVAAAEPPPVAVLEDAAGAHRARADHVAREEARVEAGLREDPVPAVVQVGEVAPGALLAVDTGDHRPAPAVELVGRDDDRAEARGEVLPLRRAETHAPLAPLELARGPVVHDGEAAYPSTCADDHRDLQLVVELLGPLRIGNLVLRAVDRRRVGEVEDRQLVPLRRNVSAAKGTGVLDVLLERVEVAHRGRVQDGRPEVDVGEGVLRVPPGRAAASEERLERLRRQLVNGVALDEPRPAALERELARCEHAEAHQGSVWTTTSAMSGRARRMRSSISLARPWASASAVVGSSASVRYATRPSFVRRKRSLRGDAPVTSRTMRATP